MEEASSSPFRPEVFLSFSSSFPQSESPFFSSFDHAINRHQDLAWGEILLTPFELGAWALLEPMGSQNHAPQLCWLRPNVLACVWMAGDQEGTAGMSIFLSLLSEERGGWSEPQCISKDPDRSEQNPLLFVSDGCLHLIHSAQRVRDSGDTSWKDQDTSFSMQWTAMLRHQELVLDNLDLNEPSTWGADAWTASEDLLDTAAFCRHPPYRTGEGTWLLSIYRSLEQGGSFGHDHTEILPLSAEGRASGPPVQVPDSVGRVHGSIVPSADGRTLLQFFRSRLADHVYRSESCDGGRTWLAPEPTMLPNNNSSIQACRLCSGRLALIFNRFGLPADWNGSEQVLEWGEARWPRTRWPLSIALSDDDGFSWPWIRDIDTGFGFSGSLNWTLNGQLAYPTLLEGQPGELHVAYSWAGRQAIRYVCLHESEILGAPEDVFVLSDV